MGPHRTNGEAQGYRPRIAGDKAGALPRESAERSKVFTGTVDDRYVVFERVFLGCLLDIFPSHTKKRRNGFPLSLNP
jgi:hypothetical protein